MIEIIQHIFRKIILLFYKIFKELFCIFKNLLNQLLKKEL